VATAHMAIDLCNVFAKPMAYRPAPRPVPAARATDALNAATGSFPLTFSALVECDFPQITLPSLSSLLRIESAVAIQMNGPFDDYRKDVAAAAARCLAGFLRESARSMN
jgi:hypothetical protein